MSSPSRSPLQTSSSRRSLSPARLSPAASLKNLHLSREIVNTRVEYLLEVQRMILDKYLDAFTAFKNFDLNNDGVISPLEFQKKLYIDFGVPPSDASELMKSLDQDGDGVVGFTDWSRSFELATNSSPRYASLALTRRELDELRKEVRGSPERQVVGNYDTESPSPSSSSLWNQVSPDHPYQYRSYLAKQYVDTKHDLLEAKKDVDALRIDNSRLRQENEAFDLKNKQLLIELDQERARSDQLQRRVAQLNRLLVEETELKNVHLSQRLHSEEELRSLKRETKIIKDKIMQLRDDEVLAAM